MRMSERDARGPEEHLSRDISASLNSEVQESIGRDEPMPLKMKKTVQQMVFDEASSQIETVPTEEAIKLVGQPGVTFIDIRDPRELRERDGGYPRRDQCHARHA